MDRAQGTTPRTATATTPAVPTRPAAPRSTRLLRDQSAIVTWVEATMSEVLGWAPEDLLGRPSTLLIHPEDQRSALEAWFAMLAAPGETRSWRGRYRTTDGSYVLVETTNHNTLDDPQNPVVTTTMTVVGAAADGLEETLRIREQMLVRLADALPVGLFHLGSDLEVLFTNDRLHDIIGGTGRGSVGRLGDLFARVSATDRPLLDEAVRAVLADRAVDDVQIALDPVAGGSVVGGQVCVLSMRPLTGRDGTVTGALGCLSDVTERAQLHRQLERRATTDDLTGCLNRAATLERLGAGLAAPDGGVAVVYIDVDGFKQVNDHQGHLAGDQLLREVADRLRGACRDLDHLGRIGGDEFLVVCPGVPDPRTALAAGTRLAESLAGPVTLAGTSIVLRASIGVAWTDEPVNPDLLVARADHAMYENKTAKDRPARLFDAG